MTTLNFMRSVVKIGRLRLNINIITGYPVNETGFEKSYASFLRYFDP